MGPPAYLPTDPASLSFSAALVWRIFAGQPIPTPLGGTGAAVDVRDVARLFVFAAEQPAKADGQRYLAVGGIAHPQAVADVLREALPGRRAVVQAGSPGVGYDPSLQSDRFDVAKTVTDTGEAFIGLRESVVDAAKVMEVEGKAKGWH